MLMVKNMQKFLTCLLLVAISFITVNFTTPTMAYATGINDATITISSDGKISTGGDLVSQDSGTAWTKIIDKFKKFVVGVSGIGMVLMILNFTILLLKLSTTAGNPGERQKVLMGLVWSFVAAACLGSITMFVGFFYHVFS